MAFIKKSVSVTRARPVKIDLPPEIGDVRDGRVWDGKEWVSEEVWKDRIRAKE